jgi:hypothetical protein
MRKRIKKVPEDMASHALGFKKVILKSRGPRSPKNLRERKSLGRDLPKPSLD